MNDDVKPSAKHVKKHAGQIALGQNQQENTAKHEALPVAPSENQPKVDFDIDELALDDSLSTSSTSGSTPAPEKPRKSWKERLKPSWPPGKKEWLTLAVLVIFCG